eukprot:TRINITY_DN11527_c0_g1_i1.p1 TRINITY_DN11527_c0_g1~~TRINITY_DN11527_c0_g1_i1.p1  ORF type:complete len:292 (+),score=49.72 TRINITY_DN11527_c0_g1_i1:27-878(+)
MLTSSKDLEARICEKEKGFFCEQTTRPLTRTEEMKHRISACVFLVNLAEKLAIKVPHEHAVTATGLVLLHKFYLRHSFLDPRFNSYIVSAACLVLAGKAEDAFQRKLETVASLLDALLKGIKPPVLPPTQAAVVTALRETEIKILESINFELWLQHPHDFVVSYAKFSKVSKEQYATAWSICNDLGVSDLCLRFEPQLLAAAALFIAAAAYGSTFQLEAFNEQAARTHKRASSMQGENRLNVATPQLVRRIAKRITHFYDGFLPTAKRYKPTTPTPPATNSPP